jgi:hypothetical protein
MSSTVGKIKQTLLHPGSRAGSVAGSTSPTSNTSGAPSPEPSTTALDSSATAGSQREHLESEQHGKPLEELSEAEQQASKYRLTVHAGPAYDSSNHQAVLVNAALPEGSCAIENQWIKGTIRVRIRSYTGLPSNAPAACPAYFDDPSRAKDKTQYSISFNFVPKQDLPADTAIWGNDFDHPVKDRLPPGFNMAVGIVKRFIDPTIDLDAYADKPWMFAPATCCFFAMRIGEKKESWEQWQDEELQDRGEEPLEEGADGS